MKKIIFALILLSLFVNNAKSINFGFDNAVYKKAFTYAHKKRWDKVSETIKNSDDKKMQKIFAWMEFVDESKKHNFDEISEFFYKNSDWPKQTTLKKNIENSINKNTDKEKLKKWFDKYPPTTLNGLRYYVPMLVSDGKSDEAKALVKKSWINMRMCAAEQRDFRSIFKKYLDEADYVTKIDKFLWKNNIKSASNLLKYVGSGYQKLFNARIALKDKKKNVSKYIAAVPKELKSNPALAFDRAVYRRKNDDLNGAITIHKSTASPKGSEEKWYAERTIVYHKLLAEKRYKEAYNLFSNHKHEDSTFYVHSEWNLAFIAYRFLKDYNQALIHLNNMERKSTSSVSRARVHYYAGLCLEKLNRFDEARAEFKNGTKYNMSFYGQLSSAKSEPLIRQVSRNNITQTPNISKDSAEYKKIENHELVDIVKILKKYNENSLVDIFALRLSYIFDKKDETIALSLLFRDLGKPNLAVVLSRKMRIIGEEMGQISFPKPDYKVPLFVDKNLAYSIMRQESDFNPNVVSGAKAMGLMQILPSTAKMISTSIKEKYYPTRLLDDPEYNILIGTNYIESLIKRFDGSYILAIAAYNAGPTNVNRWLKAYGDLGDSEEDILTWIEMIPFPETRNYVQRVLENLYIYRILSAKTTAI